MCPAPKTCRHRWSLCPRRKGHRRPLRGKTRPCGEVIDLRRPTGAGRLRVGSQRRLGLAEEGELILLCTCRVLRNLDIAKIQLRRRIAPPFACRNRHPLGSPKLIRAEPKPVTIRAVPKQGIAPTNLFITCGPCSNER